MLREPNYSPTIIVNERTVAQITLIPNKVILVNFIDSLLEKKDPHPPLCFAIAPNKFIWGFLFLQTFLFLNSDRKIKNPEYKFPHIQDHYYGNK